MIKHNGQLLGAYRWELGRVLGSLGFVKSTYFIYRFHFMTTPEIKQAVAELELASQKLTAVIKKEQARVASSPQEVIAQLLKGLPS